MKEQKNNNLNSSEKYCPVRTCIVCRKKLDKNNLNRIVKMPDGSVIFDKNGKADGRGAYICNDVECLKKLKNNRLLNRAFKCEVENSVYDAIEEAFVDKQEQN